MIGLLILSLSLLGVAAILFLGARPTKDEEIAEIEIEENQEWLPDFVCPDADEWLSYEEVDDLLKEDIIYSRLREYSYGY